MNIIYTQRYTFDQGKIQSDRTGNFFTAIEVLARCKAFTGDKIREHRVQISADKTVRVWDRIAQHFTACHCLKLAAQRRIVKMNVR